ncbi:hypothetical protein BIU97_06855 [Curtobacterium sp. MCBA15_009]|uniref:hypothetical protein n=1 Tax=Curtobacterium sp. MCBA15_009 TaxID=1898737 RepID=UPI0008DDA393|nr:hypothetical protein [Curtobacterium sp. MCBA15_009]OII11594.1 hypothetical protein BIU97_06855 [Curtobacterium sp. MCBA15_009]
MDGEWGDPWASRNDDAYAALLAHVRSGPPGPVTLDVDHLGWDWGMPAARVRSAALRLEDLGIVTRGAGGSWEYAVLSDADLSDAFDAWVALFGPAVRATTTVLTPHLRDELDRLVAAAERTAALRLPDFPTAFSASVQFWFTRCPDTLLRDLGTRAYERLRWARVPTVPWSVHDLHGWSRTVARVAATGDPDDATAAAERMEGLIESHRRHLGIVRTTDREPLPAGPHPSVLDRGLLRHLRSGALPTGSTHTVAGLVALTGARPDDVLDTLRWLVDLGLVVDAPGGVRVAAPSIDTWREAMELLTGVFGNAALHVLPDLREPALEEFLRLVDRARDDGHVRDHRYTESAFAVTRFLSEQTENRWVREALRLAMARLAYALPEAPPFRQWETDALWMALEAAAGRGDVRAARAAGREFTDVARAHIDDVTTRYGTMGT